MPGCHAVLFGPHNYFCHPKYCIALYTVCVSSVILQPVRTLLMQFVGSYWVLLGNGRHYTLLLVNDINDKTLRPTCVDISD